MTASSTVKAVGTMSLSVAGKYAVITGAGSGINLAFARLLLEKGCSVMIGDLALRPEAQQLLEQYPHPQPGSSDNNDTNRPSALFQETNVASWPSLSRLWSSALSYFPRIDIVVPGAGLFEPAWSSFWHAPKTESNPDSESRDAADADPGSAVAPGAVMKETVADGRLQTPMWSEDPGKKHMTQGEGVELFLEPGEVARGMLELCENPEYGNGTILEVSKGATRVVPLYRAGPPSGVGVVLPRLAENAEKVWKKLEGPGLKI
ncbi:short chain dehydrogenase [Colletotrichum simmondsii]|uniref:Short chain dehydrogenase n=1 Tax=Colletotrichum simmondsii TaxID=703756 RepID=A0A135SH19_9PEZI|nr:short chain dehydrogenase [Colletotrichum simmondsii]